MHVSAAAAALIELLTADSLESQAIRIDLRAESGSLRMTLARDPGGAETVIGERGVLVYLHPDVAERLELQTLDASTAWEKPAFYLR